VTRSLHDWALSQQAGPVNEEDLVARAAALLPRRPSYAPGSPMLHVVVAGGPAQQLLRPGNLDDPALHSTMEQQALYGQPPVLDRGQGVQAGVSGITLAVRQGNAEITLDEQGSIRVTRPGRDPGGRDFGTIGIPSLIEEDIRDRVTAAIRYSGWLLDRVDQTRRLTKVALACRLDGVGYLPWRTRQEAATSPNSAPMNLAGLESADSPPVILSRAALNFDAANQAEDMTVRLRRHAKR
jgi:hypothetical protein